MIDINSDRQELTHGAGIKREVAAVIEKQLTEQSAGVVSVWRDTPIGGGALVDLTPLDGIQWELNLQWHHVEALRTFYSEPLIHPLTSRSVVRHCFALDSSAEPM